MDWAEEVRARLLPASGTPVSGAGLSVCLLLAAGLIVWPAAWTRMRLVVTLVHELGHALVGTAVGRRFTGFVVGGDASGHAVTVGPSRGPGRVAMTWAGYPAPAIAGAWFVWAALRGWAAPTLAAVLLLLVLALVRVRSWHTLIVLGSVAGVVAGLWWRRVDSVQAYAVLAVGAILLAGAWRGLWAVATAGRHVDDPAVLASLTRVPRLVWLISWVLACGAATALAFSQVRRMW